MDFEEMRGAMERATGEKPPASIYSRGEPWLDFERFEEHFKKPYHDDNNFCRHVGITRFQLRNYRMRGIRFYVADRLCIENGVHPSLIWGEDYWNPPKRVLKQHMHLLQEGQQ